MTTMLDRESSEKGSNMHVLHCVPAFSHLTQTFTYNLITRLPMYGTPTSVIAWQRVNPESRPFEHFHLMPRPTNSDRLWNHLAASTAPIIELPRSRFERQLSDILTQLRPDCVHAQFGSVAAWIYRVCAELGIPLIVTFRGKDASEKLRKPHWWRTYRQIARNAAALTAVSEDLADHLRAKLPEATDCYVIYSGINTEAIPFREPREAQGRLLSVGRLVSKKGHDDAIRALAAVRREGVEAKLTIIGDGHKDEEAALRKLIDDLELNHDVKLTGSLPHDQVLEAYRQADLLIAANRTGESGDREGVPNVLKEALLCGLPVVATRHGGIPSAIPEEFQDELIEEGDHEALASRIINLLREDRAQLLTRATRYREHILAHFSIEAEIRAYQRLYQLCCRGSRP